MSEPLTLEVLDGEGAVQTALDEGPLSTRSELFRKAVLGGGTLVAGGVMIGGLPQIALGKPSARQDAVILNFALLLEYLESEFYVQAVAGGRLTGDLLGFATVVRDHELAHVELLQTALGNAAISKPAFDFKGTTTDVTRFVATAIVLEDTGVAAYNGQGPRLRRRTLPAAASIVSVEARHAAWIRKLAAAPAYAGGAETYPAPAVLDTALSKRRVEAAVGATGFILA